MIEPKVGKLIQQAKEKIWENPEAALKEVEELAESFGHPENYRALLRFYEVRNVGGTPVLKRAQRLWELTRDSSDPTLWQVLLGTFEPRERWRPGKEWSPDMDFVQAVWRDAGKSGSSGIFLGFFTGIPVAEFILPRWAQQNEARKVSASRGGSRQSL